MASPADPTPAPLAQLSDANVLRWGSRGLAAFLVFGVAASLLLASQAPLYALLVPASVVAVGLLVWLARRPYYNLYVALFGFALVVISDPGVGPAEVLYGVYLLFFFAMWYARYLLPEHRTLHTAEDRIVALLLTVGLAGGVVVGLLFGTPPGEMRGAIQGFLMLAFYFPIKDLCAHHRRGPEIMLAAVAWLGLYVTAVIFLNFREVLVHATVDWHVADARPGYNALQLMLGALLGLILLVSLRRRAQRLTAFVLFTACLAALVLIKYRGFWVAFAFGAGVVFLLLQRGERRRLVVYAVTGFAALIFVTTAFFGEIATLLFSGTLERFATLQTAFTKDVSLLNRLHEASAALDYIRVNPLLGYGFGTRYTYYSWVYLATYHAQLIHIGYVEIWFRLGLFGMLGVFFVWIRSAWWGWRVSRTSAPQLHQMTGLLTAAGLAAMIFSVFTESPWFQMNQMFGFTMLIAMASGLRQRYADRLSLR